MAVFGLSLEGRPPYFGLLIGLAVAVTISLGAEWKFFKHQRNEIGAKEVELSRLEDKIQEGRAAEAKLPQFREEVRRLELELEKLLRILPAGYQTPALLRHLRTLLEQGDLKLRLWKPKKMQEKDFYNEWPITIRLDGGYHSLALFFDRLSRYPRIVNVEKLKISAARQQGPNRTASANFTAKTFAHKDRDNLDEDELDAARSDAEELALEGLN